MPYNRPTLTDLRERMADDVDARLPGADSRLRRSTLGVLVAVLAGALFGLYGLLDWVWRQIFPDTAEGDQLARWASIWGVRRKAGEPASGNVTFTGTNGTVIPAGTELVRADGISFETAADAIITGGTATVAVVAADAGAAGNTAASTKLTLAVPVIGVGSAATVAAGGLADGAGDEADEDLRARLLDRIQRPPHGGNASDYRQWALQVPGVTRAWVTAGELGLGTVTVRFVMDGRVNIIPLAEDVEAVADYIDVLRPVTADVAVIAPVGTPVDLVIEAQPPGPETEAAIRAELEDLFRREAEPGGTILISHIREAISIAAGETDHVLVTPAANVVMPTGALATIGTVTFA